MNKFLSVLAVILFWISSIVLIPLGVFLGSAIIIFYLSASISSIVYDSTFRFLRKRSINRRRK